MSLVKDTGRILLVLLMIGLTNCLKEEEEVPELKSKVVINELLPINNIIEADQDGEFDDWIELYNQSDEDLDLSGYYLTDSKKNLTKWKFPEGTFISANNYLIIWADGDTLQAGLHTNYKLSSKGEKVLLLTPELSIVDETEYPSTVLEHSWARIPDGTGDFQWTTPTFNAPNE
ncbi:MAG: lamin tail domain-containing protein [Bacteroidota bacterium]